MLGLFLPNHLQWIQIPVHSREDCESIFPGYITDNMVCAGSAGAATCNGDSGGPLVCPDESGNGNKVLHCQKEYLLTLSLIRKLENGLCLEIQPRNDLALSIVLIFCVSGFLSINFLHSYQLSHTYFQLIVANIYRKTCWNRLLWLHWMHRCWCLCQGWT